MTETGLFQITLSPAARADLLAVSDLKTRAAIAGRIDDLEREPLKQGKALVGELKTFRSVRAAGQRYRVVYQVAVSAGAVVVLVVGIRKEGDKRDVYRIAQKRLT